jgi:Arc/MetJ-type ribon-helix-helix transcriptional regulator
VLSRQQVDKGGLGLRITIHMDGVGMVMGVHNFRPKAGDATEKITINLGVIDLGQIDLLVQEGFYSNRTDLIRTAIRNQLATHAEVLKSTVARKSFVLGLQHYTRRDLEAVQSAGETLQIQVLGLASIAEDVSPALARATIASIVVLGVLQASADVKAALADRIH